MPRIYEICADEAWTHGGTPIRRYWCFFGGIFGPESDLAKLEFALEAILRRHHHRVEIKWTNVSVRNMALYKALVDEFFRHIQNSNIIYRQIFLDRKYVYVPVLGEPARTDLDIQYRICYQFLKHHFGLRYLPRAQNHFDTVFIRLDAHSSEKHTEELKRLSENLPVLIGRTDLHFHVSFVNSAQHVRLQLCDLVMGAAGSRGNKMHLRRDSGKRGMTEKQKARQEMSKYIYEQLRALNLAQRGSPVFNWFESTGIDGDATNRLNHKVRIWKFIPSSRKIDKGWENDHLDKYGGYIAPDIVDSEPIREDLD